MCRVGVQLERGRPGKATVGRADIEDVALVGSRAVLGIDVVEDAARSGGGLAPAHVPNLRGDGVEVGVAATRRCSGRGEGRVLQHAGAPGGSAVSGAIHIVAAVGRSAAALVHAAQVDVAVGARGSPVNWMSRRKEAKTVTGVPQVDAVVGGAGHCAARRRRSRSHYRRRTCSR